ncbi:MAG TPA: hypothetical protein DDX39_03745 [Bacteroidales bacterium]|nr:MAG: hypothetical protein A2W98_12575 [Bacteroidetes bacterium GWF2_33_38]OFY88751.1 MAG: hypothetical protein A2236_03695 [Bacteroidetes bacterium RIFOXYA2_FULL_33_7]HBF87734.1 hypothetical protein [Bacteroidales bacterium]
MHKIKIVISIVFLILFIENSTAQPTKGEANSNFDINNCEVALTQYLKLLKSEKENTFFHYRIGLCYLKTNLDKKAAIPYLEYAAKDPKIEKSIQFDIAQAYYYAHKFDTALSILNNYKSQGLVDSILAKVNKQIRYAENAQRLIKKPLDVTLVNLGEMINTKRADYNPFVIEDESVIYYASNKKYISDFQELINSVYFSKSSNGKWQKMKSIGSKVNTDESQVLVGISKDGNTLYIQPESFDTYLNLYSTTKVKNRFNELIALGKTINTKDIECGASPTVSGDTIYFASDKEGGFGGMDIYLSIKLPNGEWGIPVNLGNEINTAEDENYPNISNDGNVMYFCSTGYNSMGGYDIFVSRKNTDGIWSKPENIGYPINDTYDNLTISFTQNKRYGYVSLTRDGGFGDSDIYKVIFNNVESQNIVYTGVIAVGDSINPIQLKDVNPEISITVFNKADDEIFGTYAYSKSSGRYIITLPPGEYRLEVEGESYITYKKEIEIYETYYTNSEIEQNIYLQKK